MNVEDARRCLGVAEGASPEEVKRAWRVVALKWHPDLHPDGPSRAQAEERFKQAQSAYTTLSVAAPPRRDAVGGDEREARVYTRRSRGRPSRSQHAHYQDPGLGYDKNARAKITFGLSFFAVVLCWANLAWFGKQSPEDRRVQQARSTVSYGEQHAFWRPPPRRL